MFGLGKTVLAIVKNVIVGESESKLVIFKIR